MRIPWPLLVLLGGCVPPGPADDDDSAVASPTPTPDPYDASQLPAGPSPIRGPARVEILRVVDGDTAIVLPGDSGEERVRLLSINSPELHTDDDIPECDAEAAWQRTQALLPEGSFAWLTFEGELRDAYGRLLSYVYAGERPEVDGFEDSVNYRLVREGHARTYFFANNQTYRDTLESAEDRAQFEDLGMWACP